MTFKAINKNGLVPASLVNCLIFQAIPEKKIQIIRPVTKVRVLSSIEQQELFQDKVEKKAEDESKK